LIRYHASWVVPIAGRPIRDASVAIEDGRIQAVGRSGRQSTDVRDLGDVFSDHAL